MTEAVLIGALIVTHGQLGQELLAAAEMIVGEINHIGAVSIGWHDDVEQSQKEIEAAIDNVDQGRGVIVLTDMFGGTPSNISFSLLQAGKMEIVTGVNLPMIIKLANQEGVEALEDLVVQVKMQGQKHITVASEVLGE